jgi:hypothetical protein
VVLGLCRRCTSGHAISELSNLQIPSLKAVIGFWWWTNHGVFNFPLNFLKYEST